MMNCWPLKRKISSHVEVAWLDTLRRGGASGVLESCKSWLLRHCRDVLEGRVEEVLAVKIEVVEENECLEER